MSSLKIAIAQLNFLVGDIEGNTARIIQETKKIFHDPNIRVIATTVRVPVFRAHSEALFIETEKKLSADQAREILKKAPGVKVVDDREKNYFPMPLEATGRDEVLVGRIREDQTVKNGLALFVSGDQLRKGAALNAVQIAEAAFGLLKTENRKQKTENG